MVQLESDMQKEIDKQVHLLKKVTRERDEANESQQSAKKLFNEQKRVESQIDRMKDEVNRSNKAIDKM